jgi:hypothetical protein
MSRAEQQESRISYLLRFLCDERLNDDEAAELAHLLETSNSARRRYVEHVQLCVELGDWSQATSPVSILHPAANLAVNGEAARRKAVKTIVTKEVRKQQPRVKGNEAPPGRRWSWFQPWVTLGAAAAMLMIVSLCGWSYFRGKNSALPMEPDAVAGVVATGGANHEDRQKRAHPEKFVARVVEVTADARWDDDLHPREFLMRLREGDELHLLSGLAHLEFYSGARIILQGPSKFTPTGPARGKLESGRLTGKVDGGKFQLTTPTAKVVDLGTEFGVTVGPSSDTDVCVFVGEVEVQPGLDRHEKNHPFTEAYNLTQGMSVRVAATGKVSDGMDAGVDYDVYTRSFPSRTNLNSDELDLVDIVCGGNGQGTRLAAAIDPLTGQLDRRPWKSPLSPGTRKGDGVFHPAIWHPFIDGTFVPNKRGEPTQVDTQHGTIRLPKEGGDYTWGPIWARRAVKDPSQFDRSADSWGAKTFPVITERLTRCRLGGIGIHASVGITFDLRAIGKEHPGRINQLKGTLANLENSKEHNPDWASTNPPPSADFRVFVDGQLRYEKRNFARNVEGVPFEVALSSKDRFLTFVTTDAGNSNKYDHIVVIDPVLEIQDSNPSRLSSAATPARIRQTN